MAEAISTTASSAAPGNGWPRVLKFRAAWLLALLPFVAYLPALRGGFVWDDLVLVQRNPLVTGDLTIFSVWFQGDFPLSTVGLWLQWLLWGDFAPGYHVVNVALHAINATLLWRVLLRLNVPGAWLGAVLFAVHPVAVASVAWISELKNTLSLCFLLASVWCWLQSGSVLKRRVDVLYLAALAFFILALLSKTSTVMLPVVLLLLAAWRGGLPPRSEWLRLTPFFALSLGFGMLTIWFQRHQVIGDLVMGEGSLAERCAQAGAMIWFYFGKALAPVNLCMIYPAWNFSGATVWLPAGLWLLLLAGSWKFCGGRQGGTFVALASFTVFLFPVLGFFDMYFFALARVSDHLQYLPLLCITAMLGAGLAVYLPDRLRIIVGAALVLGFGALTFQRAGVFATDENLWRDTLAKNPAAWNAHNNLGCLMAERGDVTGAMKHFEASLQWNPGNAQAHVNYARGLAAQGSLNLAETHFRMAQKIRPGDPESYTHYAEALVNAGRLPEAIALLRAAVKLKASADIHLQLAGLYRATGNVRDAIGHTRAAVKARPDWPEALGNLAWLLATANDGSVRDGREAVQLAGRACELTRFKDARLLGTLAAAHAENRDFANAMRQAERAVAVAQAAGDRQLAAMNQQLLLGFRAGQPVRER